MTSDGYLAQLAPELVLLLGACAVLVLGVARTPLGGLSVSRLLLVTVWSGLPDNGRAIPGLWITSLTHYTRCIALLIGALIILVSWHQPAEREGGEYMALILFSLLGVLLTASANDLLVLFFAIELVSVPTYILIALSRPELRASEAAVKYFFLGAMSAAILAYGLSLLYGVTGTTTIHTFTEGVVDSPLAAHSSLGPLALVGMLLVLGGLAFKVAAVPFHVYAADVYEGAASPVTGLLGFVPKLAGFVALIKIFAACNWDLPASMMWVVWMVAAATMTVGNVLALLQRNVKRMLAYSSIAHTGYMLIGLLVGPVAGEGPMRDGVAALLFYVGVYGAMNLGAFALLTAFRTGTRATETLDDLAGLASRAPLAAIGLAICVFSLMGFPPTAGFIGKVYIFSSAFSLDVSHPFQGPLIALAIIGVVNSAIAATYYLRIVMSVYMGSEIERAMPTAGAPVRWGLALCSIPLLVLFAWPGAAAQPARRATAVLHDTVQATQAKLTSTMEPDESTPSGPH
jgi:NADH-quinone oxidoreductase subunit N